MSILKVPGSFVGKGDIPSVQNPAKDNSGAVGRADETTVQLGARTVQEEQLSKRRCRSRCRHRDRKPHSGDQFLNAFHDDFLQ